MIAWLPTPFNLSVALKLCTFRHLDYLPSYAIVLSSFFDLSFVTLGFKIYRPWYPSIFQVPSTPHEMRLERLPFDSIPDVERKEREDDIDALFVAASSTTASVARTTAATPNNVDDMASCLFTPAQSQVLVNDEDDLSVADGFDGTMSNANQLPPFPQELPSHAPWSPSDQSLLPPMPPMMPSPSSSMPTSTVSAQQGSTHESSNAVANDKLPSRSLAVVRCYICDRLTGLSSVAWHHKRCTQSFHARNNGPSVPPILRRALAEPPSVPLPNYITALNGARSDEEDSEEVESRENNSGNDSEVLATQIAAYNTAARRIYHNEVQTLLLGVLLFFNLMLAVISEKELLENSYDAFIFAFTMCCCNCCRCDFIAPPVAKASMTTMTPLITSTTTNMSTIIGAILLRTTILSFPSFIRLD